MITDFPSVTVIQCIQEYSAQSGIFALLVIGLILLGGGAITLMILTIISTNDFNKFFVAFMVCVVGAFLCMNSNYKPETPAKYEVTISQSISIEEYNQLKNTFDLSGPSETPVGETWTATQKLDK
jgi:hypothetical protein